MQRVRLMLLGVVLGAVLAFTFLGVSAAMREESSSKVCDPTDRVCATRTQTEATMFGPAEDELWISIGVENCGTSYPMPFDLPDDEFEVTFRRTELVIHGPAGEVATYPTTGDC